MMDFNIFRLKTFIFFLVLFSCFLAVYSQGTKDIKILFYRGQHLEEVKGELAKAIKVYQEVLERFPDKRTYAARALLRIGICYKKMGDQQAQQAFQRIIQEFGDQPEIAAEAQTRLQVLKKPERLIAGEGMISRQVWADPQTDPSGSISPDGRYLTFTDWSRGDLYVRDLVTGINRKLTNNPSGSLDFAIFAKWSPYGQEIAYFWNERPFNDLRIIGMDGSKPRTIFHDESVKWIMLGGWSPDGKLISMCIEDKHTPNQTIALISIESGDVKVLKTEKAADTGMGPFTPDGRYIIYDRSQKEDAFERDIFLLATDGSGEIPLIEHSADDRVLCLSPDGDWLLYRSNRSGTHDAWLIQIENGRTKGTPRLINPGIGNIFPLGLTNDVVFFYSSQSRNRDPYIVDFDPEALTIISEPKRINQRFIGSGHTPDWSPDGKLLAYRLLRINIPEQSPSQVLVIHSLDSGEERELRLKGTLEGPVRWIRWFPDNLSLLIYGTDMKGKLGFFRIDAQTANMSPLFLFQPGEIIYSPSISPDGKSVYFSILTKKATVSRIVTRNLETGEEKILCEEVRPKRCLIPALSPDGQKIVFQLIDGENFPDYDILQILPTDGGEPVELMKEQVPAGKNINTGTGLAWTPDGSHVIFTRYTGDNDLTEELWVIPAEGGAPKKLGLDMIGIQFIRVHPNGKQICFSAGRFIDEIWMLENFLPKK